MTERWIKRTAGVPRGLLRFLVLKMLKEKPMSGAEIVEEIKRETGGRWKPSPGSIYPLLAWLQDKGYTNETPTLESGMKRYALTDEGKAFLKREVELGQKFLAKLEYLAPMFVGGFEFGVDRQDLHDIRESGKRLVKTFIDIRAALKDELTEHDAEEIAGILNNCAQRLEKVAKRITEKNPRLNVSPDLKD